MGYKRNCVVWIKKKANGVREWDRETSNQEGVSHMRGWFCEVQGMGMRIVIETASGRKVFDACVSTTNPQIS
jgi:hypothetical protein